MPAKALLSCYFNDTPRTDTTGCIKKTIHFEKILPIPHFEIFVVDLGRYGIGGYLYKFTDKGF